MKRSKILLAVPVILAFALVVAFSASRFGESRDNSVGPPPQPPNAIRESAASVDREASLANVSGKAATGTTIAPTKGQGGSWSLFAQQERIIRTGSLALNVIDVQGALDRVSDIVARIPFAFISNMNVSQNGETQSATITLQVPSDSFDQALGQLRGIAEKVDNVQVSSQDVSEEFVDLESQLRHLKATEDSYLQLLGRAQKIEDILSIQDRLNGVQSQIERTQGRLNFLEKRTSFSTITAKLLPLAAATTSSTPLWNPAQTIVRALENLGVAFQGALDLSIYVLVYSLPLLAVAGGALFVWRQRSLRLPKTQGQT